MANRPWYEDADFWENWAPYLFDSTRLNNAIGEVDQLVRLLHLTPGSEVLDVCCGPGRHAVELASKGYRVTGVDQVHSYLDQARRRAKERQVELGLIESDVQRLNLLPHYDVAINMFSSFGYYPTQEYDVMFAANIYRALKSGGRFVVETDGKEILARDFRSRDWYRHEDETISLHERKILDGWEFLESHWSMIRHGQIVFESTIVQRIYSGLELRQILERVGFRDVVLHGGLDGTPYDHAARRLVAIAGK